MSIEQFELDHAQKKLTEYPLSSSSVVFDVGGYLGDWTYDIIKRGVEVCACCGGKQDAYICLFEPVGRFYQHCKDRFKDYNKVHVYPFGLWNQDYEAKIGIDDSGSSVYSNNLPQETVQMRDISKFIYDQQLDHIDLISINIEGGEYDLLERMISSGVIQICKNVQIQFHDFVPEAIERRSAIQASLYKTHKKKFDYPFVWESWHLVK